MAGGSGGGQPQQAQSTNWTSGSSAYGSTAPRMGYGYGTNQRFGQTMVGETPAGTATATTATDTGTATPATAATTAPATDATTAPATTAPAVPTPPPLEGGMFGFNPAQTLNKRQMQGREMLSGSAYQFQAPKNVMLGADFNNQLSAINSQFLPQAPTGRGSALRKSTAAYNQAMAGLGGNAQYQTAMQNFMKSQGLQGLLPGA